MIDNLKALYVAIFNNEVVCFETNLTAFYYAFNKIESEIKGYDSFYRRFKKEKHFMKLINGKEYWFQKVLDKHQDLRDQLK